MPTVPAIAAVSVAALLSVALHTPAHAGGPLDVDPPELDRLGVEGSPDPEGLLDDQPTVSDHADLASRLDLDALGSPELRLTGEGAVHALAAGGVHPPDLDPLETPNLDPPQLGALPDEALAAGVAYQRAHTRLAERRPDLLDDVAAGVADRGEVMREWEDAVSVGSLSAERDVSAALPAPGVAAMLHAMGSGDSAAALELAGDADTAESCVAAGHYLGDRMRRLADPDANTLTPSRDDGRIGRREWDGMFDIQREVFDDQNPPAETQAAPQALRAHECLEAEQLTSQAAQRLVPSTLERLAGD